jgi:hypothetical protein
MSMGGIGGKSSGGFTQYEALQFFSNRIIEDRRTGIQIRITNSHTVQFGFLKRGERTFYNFNVKVGDRDLILEAIKQSYRGAEKTGLDVDEDSVSFGSLLQKHLLEVGALVNEMVVQSDQMDPKMKELGSLAGRRISMVYNSTSQKIKDLKAGQGELSIESRDIKTEEGNEDSLGSLSSCCQDIFTYIFDLNPAIQINLEAVSEEDDEEQEKGIDFEKDYTLDNRSEMGSDLGENEEELLLDNQFKKRNPLSKNEMRLSGQHDALDEVDWNNSEY